jgi:hypothetical protein
MNDTGVGPQRHNDGRSVIGTWRPKRILLFMAVAFVGGVWLSPVAAHSQTAAEWNRTVCGARGTGLSLKRSGLQDTNFLFASVNRPTQTASSGGACLAAASPFHQSLANRSQWSSLGALAQRRSVPVFLSTRGTVNGRIGPLSRTTIAVLSKAGFPSSPDTWVGHTGLWSVSTNWSSGIPTTSSDVLVTNSGSVVTEDIAGSINNLTLSSGNSLSLNNGINLTIGGTTISNAGNIKLNSTANNTGITINTGTVTLSGGGTITLTDSSNPQNYIVGNSSATLVNMNNVIQGSGTIGNSQLALNNAGTIDADNADHVLTLQVSATGATNTGTLEATNGGNLILNGSTYNNHNGTIKATAGGIVQLSNVTIEGGTFTTDSGMGSLVETANGTNNTLDGTTQGTITNTGTFAIGNNSNARVQGTINNSGSITLNGTLYHSNMILVADTTLSGSGTVTLVDSGNPQNYIYGQAATTTLTNAQTIQGTGTIGFGSMALHNTGTIDANDADHGLLISTSNGTTNTGTLEATNGGTLQLSSDTFDNVGGTIKALNGSKVQLASGAVIEGGTLSTDSGHGSTISTLSGSSALLDGLTLGTLNNAGAFVASNNSTTNLQGTINNTGSISLNSTGNVVYLQLKGNTTLTGSGTVTLTPFSSLNDYIFGQTNTTMLTNVNNTIAGSGTIGDGSMILVNQTGGIINANTAGKSLVVSVSGTGVGTGVNGTNAGLMESTATNSTSGPSQLILSGGTINNTGGTIEALNGGVVQLDNSVTIQSGTLTTDSGHGSLVETVFGDRAYLDGKTQGALKNSGAFSVANNSIAFIKGTINNTGSITLNGSYYGTYLELNDNTTLSGAGTVTLADSGYPQNFIQGTSGTYVLTNQQTIQGSGVIGNGEMGLANSGTINADNADHGLLINTSSGTANTGTLEATNGATLQLSTDTFNNTGGTIKALNGSSVQLLNNAIIQGGTVRTDTGLGSTISTLSGNSATLDGMTHGSLTLYGNYVGQNNSTTKINGDIANGGTITLESQGNYTYLELLGNTTLHYSGNVILAPSAISNNYIYGSSATNTLTNVNDIISGAGTIGNGSLILVNQAGGTINANVAGQSLTVSVSSNSVGTGVNGTNTGLIESTASNSMNGPSQLILNGGTINNSGGTIKALNGGVVELYNGVTIQGGTLTTDSGLGSLVETVSSDRSVTLDGMSKGTLNNSGAFSVANNSTAFLKGAINNTGSITLNGVGNGTYLELLGNTTLSGSGTVTLADSVNPQNYIFGHAGSDTLTNQQTIQGSGTIGNGTMALINSGTINANNADNQLVINTSNGTTNTGTLEATNGGTLVLANDVFNNHSGTMNGTIKAVGSSMVGLSNNVTIQGGTLSTDSTSTIEVLPGTSAVLDGTTQGTLTNASAFKIANSSTAYLKGTINNTGSIALLAAGNNTTLLLMANTTLTGGGTVTLTDSPLPTNYIYGQSGSYVLTNQNNTIQGAGNIGDGQMGLINNGTILSNGSGLAIQPGSAGFTNNGTLQVASGSSMHVFGGPFTNFSGSTLTGGAYNVSGTLEVDQLGSAGGEIITNAANITLNGATSSFLDAGLKNALSALNTNATGGIFTITGGRNFTTAGGFTNNGTLAVGSTNSTFKVNGNLTNFSGTTLTGGTYNLTGTLQFNNANIVTNAANITLTGTSSQIINQSSGNALANFATNASGGSFTINGGRNFTTASNFTNNGTITTGSTATFAVNGNLTNYNSTSKTLTGGTYFLYGALQFNGANIVNNAANITLYGTASKITDQHGANGLANFATNATAGIFSVQGGRTFTTVGGFTNQGLFTVGSGSTFTVGGTGTSFTQTAGTTTDDGTLALSSTGALSVQAGMLFGKGTITGAVNSSGTVTPGDSAMSTGILTETGAYTQHSTGALNIAIGGTTAGTKFDQFNATTATLGGTLNISLIPGYVPAVGSTFKIVNFNSETGTFTTVNGLGINSSEHFTIAYQGTDVLLTVVSGPLHQSAGRGGLQFPGSVRPNLDSDVAAFAPKSGFSAAKLGFTGAGKPAASSGTFHAAATLPQTNVGFLQSRQTAAFAFGAVSGGTAPHAATSGLRFPTQIGASNSRSIGANNGAYGLRNRAVGGGFVFPLSHLSKPLMGFTLE